MNFIFGMILGIGITLFVQNPDMLGSVLHKAGDVVSSDEAKDIQKDIVGATTGD
jgi:hypothetical protein